MNTNAAKATVPKVVARSWLGADRRRDLRVIHVLARIGVAKDRDDSSRPKPFPVQLVEIFSVVSQQHALEQLGELEYFRV